mgnify:CR=1 FL=1
MVKIIFGSKFYNRNYGLIFIGYDINAFVGPKILASSFDAVGSYVMDYKFAAFIPHACVWDESHISLNKY